MHGWSGCMPERGRMGIFYGSIHAFCFACSVILVCPVTSLVQVVLNAGHVLYACAAR